MAADWPQWLGPDRDGKVTGFTEPSAWPDQLAKGWSATVGSGDATPALVGGKLFVFSRQDADETTVCLDAATGKQLWIDKNPAAAVTGMSASHPGPRSSPAVADGKVVTFGANGADLLPRCRLRKSHLAKRFAEGFLRSAAPVLHRGFAADR